MMLDDQAGEDHQSISFLELAGEDSEPSAWPLERMQSVASSKLSSEGALVTPIHVVRTLMRHMIAIPILRLRLPESSPYHHGAAVKRDFEAFWGATSFFFCKSDRRLVASLFLQIRTINLNPKPTCIALTVPSRGQMHRSTKVEVAADSMALVSAFSVWGFRA